MTPDEYRKKHKSCYTCKYYRKNILIDKMSKCIVKNCDVYQSEAESCECYNPIPFKEQEK